MAPVEPGRHGRSGARQAERVWDPLVRLSHWTIAAAVLLNGLVLDEESAAHVWLGYAAGGVLALRLLWGVIGTAPARFSAFPPDPAAALAHLRDMLAGRSGAHLSHNPLGALMVYALWACLAVTVVSGVMLESAAFWDSEIVEEAHEVAANGLLLLAALHVGGVLLESRLSGVNLARAMIDGVRRPPGGRS
jgi:cytochrome b